MIEDLDLEREELRLKVFHNEIVHEWCVVDADNNFTFMKNNMNISNDVLEYKVSNKYSEESDYENYSTMDKVLVTLVDGVIKFYNQNFREIDKDLISTAK